MKLTITSKREGFRRAGKVHPDKPVTYPDGTFTDEEIKRLKQEPMLVVVEEPEESVETPQPTETPAEETAAGSSDTPEAPAQAESAEATNTSPAEEAMAGEATGASATAAVEADGQDDATGTSSVVEDDKQETTGASDAEEDGQAAAAVIPTGEALTAAILAVIPTLSNDVYTKAGAPKVAAVEAALGYGVSADDVATAWTKYSETETGAK